MCPVIIGLTGSIAMGKSTAAAMLEKMGVPVFDSDACVKEALEPNGKAFESVALTFPDVWNKKQRVIDKRKLAEIIFNDAKKKEKLENILHPLVRDAQDNFILKHTKFDAEIIVLDIPLLFETGADQRVDKTIVVTAPYFIQRMRALKRQGMTEQKLENILQSQMPDRKKRALADFVVQTGLGKAYSFHQLRNIIESFR